MNTTITEISNIFNLMVQADSRLKFYHFGWRSDINKNIDNNFDKGVKTGRLFPALHFDVPDFFQPSEELNYLGFKEDISVNLYFDDLQNYDNSGEQKTDNLIEQWAALKQITEDFISNLSEVLQYYKAGFIRTVPRFEPKSNLFNDRLITFEVSFTIAHFSECTEEVNKINLLSLPVGNYFKSYDLENYLKELDCKSLNLDGVNEYINCTNNSAFDFGGLNAFSFEVWVKFDNLTGLRMLISKWELPPAPINARGYYFGTSGNQLRFALFNTNTFFISVTSVETLNTGQWYNVSATYDGSQNISGVNIYIDNVLTTQTATVNTLSGSTLNALPLQIGGQQTFYTAGNIAKCRAWNLELTPAEISEQYNLGKIYNTPVQTANLIVDTDVLNGFWNGANFYIPDLAGITTGYISVNSEEADLLTDCP